MIENLKLEDIPESYIDIVEEIGIEAFIKLVKLMGGSSIYLPKEESLVRPIRNRVIKEAFRGNYKELSRKYKISQAQIRNIINL